MIRGGAVITGILSCESRAERRIPIRNSFLRGLPNPFFFAGDEGKKTHLEDDVLFIDAPDTYEGIPQKIWTLYSVLLDRLEFDYFFRLDDDCAPYIANIYTLLFSIYCEPDGRPDYIGGNFLEAGELDREWHIGKVSDPSANVPYTGVFDHPYLGGSGGVLLSRRAIEHIVEHCRDRFFDPKEIYEDKLHGDVLTKAGFEPMSAGVELATYDLDCSDISSRSDEQNGRVAASPEFSSSWRGRILTRSENRQTDAYNSLFFASEKKKFLFLSIAKCGCSTLKHLIYKIEHGVDLEGENIHEHFGYSHRPPSVYSLDRPDELNKLVVGGYLRFAVWRDPLERSVSTYVQKILGENVMTKFFEPLHRCSFDDYLDVCEQVVGELAPNDMEEHIRPQSEFYRQGDIDELVSLTDLDQFLIEQFNLPSPSRVNVTNSASVFVPSEQQAQRIREIYRADYELTPTWKPSSSSV